jgi:hypothetical protein
MVMRFGFKLADRLLDLTPLQSSYYLYLANKIAAAEQEAYKKARRKR